MSATVVIIGLILAVVVIAGGVGYVISIYNSLVQVKNNIDKAWKNIDVLLMQRHDEIPKLVDAVRGYMQHERSLLEKLTELRAGYSKAGTIDEKTKIENEINRGMARLKLVGEAYPELKASQNFIQLQQRISSLESSIADRREFFNDSVNIYNIQIQRFPEMLIAQRLNYGKHALLEVPEEKKQDVKVGPF